MGLLRVIHSNALVDIVGATGRSEDFSAWLLYWTGMARGNRIRSYKELWNRSKGADELNEQALSDD